MSDPAQLLAAGLRPATPRPLPTPAELNALLPAYAVEDLIARGGMGAVYRARHRQLDRPVALKVLVLDDPAAAARFATEARALARLDHPHIVHVYDVGENAGLCWLAMELVEGVNLRQSIAERSLDPTAVLALVPQLCAALQYAHDAGVVHRDIKPENILIDSQGRVRIADFGVARILDAHGDGSRLTAHDGVMGTPHYMAPEQVETPHHVDHRADLFALGVVLYELLTGELPLGRFAPPSRKVTIDVRLDQVVLRALEKDPELRYQQASHLGQQVERIAATASHGRWPWLVTGALVMAGVALLWWPRPAVVVESKPPLPPAESSSAPNLSQAQRDAAIAMAGHDAGLIRDEQFTSLSRRFDARLHETLSDSAVAQLWREQVRRRGVLAGLGSPRHQAHGDGHHIRLALRWPDGTDDLLLVYDRDLRLSGLWITPSEP